MSKPAVQKVEERLDSLDSSLRMSCMVCGSQKGQPRLSKNGLDIFQCRSCGFYFVFPPPGEELLTRFYQWQDYFQSGGVFGYPNYESKREFYLGLFRRYLELLRQHGARGRLLDMGCGNGDFLLLAQEAGFEVCGVEISDSAREDARRKSGAPVFSTAGLIEEGQESFDVITMWEFIEHLPDPDQTLKKVLPLLRPGGLVALTTPNTLNLTTLRSPHRWTEFKPPEHLQFFDFVTLTRFLSEKHGLHIVELKGIHPDFRLLSSDWIESILNWASLLRSRHDTRKDLRWWVHAALVRVLKDFPRRLCVALRMLDPHLIQTGILVVARK